MQNYQLKLQVDGDKATPLLLNRIKKQGQYENDNQNEIQSREQIRD